MNLPFSFFNNSYPKDKWIDGTLPNVGFWFLKAYLWSISGHYFLEYGLVWCLAGMPWWRTDGPLMLRFTEAWRDTAEVVFLSDAVFAPTATGSSCHMQSRDWGPDHFRCHPFLCARPFTTSLPSLLRAVSGLLVCFRFSLHKNMGSLWFWQTPLYAPLFVVILKCL